MKILHIARRFTPNAWGGTESVVASLVREQIHRGDWARLHCTSALDQPGPALVMGVEVTRHRYSYARFPLGTKARSALDAKGGNPLSPGLFRALLREGNLDILHCHTMQRLAGQVRWAARRRGLPYVVQLHGGEFAVPDDERREMAAPARRTIDWGKIPSAFFGTRGFLRDADLVLVLSREELERGRKLYPETRFAELPNGVDPSWLKIGDRSRGRLALGIPASAKMALTVARVDPQKGQEMIPETLAQTPDLHAALVGPVTVPGYDDLVRRAAQVAGVGERLHLVGPLKPESRELADAFAAADLFVLPSRHEPFGIVALEAWAAGLPVVATRVGGLAHLVTEGVDGTLVKPGDAPVLAATVRALLEQPERMKAFGFAGRDRVKREFSWHAVSEALRDLYLELLEGRQ